MSVESELSELAELAELAECVLNYRLTAIAASLEEKRAGRALINALKSTELTGIQTYRFDKNKVQVTPPELSHGRGWRIQVISIEEDDV